MTSTQLTYVFDAYCGWCYGFGPALHELAQDPDINITVISGGLFHAVSMNEMPHIPQANERISALTGVQFGPAYQAALADGSFVMDSDDAGTGLVSLKEASGGRDVEMAGAMQRAFYRDGLSLSGVTAYQRIAAEHGLDTELVTRLFLDPKTRDTALAEQEQAAALGVHSYPTLLAHTPSGLVKIGSPVATAEQLRTSIERLHAVTTKI
ncbi:DsbA family protein [Arthrobacter sp. JZ12]|uniref:DsbA family protein n=1 Tax=Arthrobacter sp. JZ12 TaxID=2654190 RepID=UPI002B47B659|nr:DsbA family protein [Arthrobacter sp. JZ12]WRH25836.1 DsbA family protein [Arthrobacter sp. JZ12]